MWASDRDRDVIFGRHWRHRGTKESSLRRKRIHFLANVLNFNGWCEIQVEMSSFSGRMHLELEKYV
jgi:hypothetical protein